MSPKMGRPKNSKNNHLPPRMAARPMKSGVVHYYYRTASGGKMPLGTDLSIAKLKWAQLETQGSVLPDDNFAAVSGRYETEGLLGKAPKTQRQYQLVLKRLNQAFASARLPHIKPKHCRQYLDGRKAKVSANRDMAVFSAMFNWARERGITDAPNPMIGVRRHTEKPRDVYVTDEQFALLHAAAVPELQDALDIARVTGQRVADVLKMRRSDIDDGHLWVRQNKTAARIGISIEDELAEIIERCNSRERTATGMYLVQTNDGQRLSYTMLKDRFNQARAASGQTWQFRDLRPKAASDLDNVTAAKELLGHKTETTTARIYRRVKGQKVKAVARAKVVPNSKTNA